MLTKLEPIDEIIKLILYSAYIVDEEQPVSALIVGVPEIGKTEELKQARLLDGILFPTDATAFGILNTYAQDLMNRTIRHILIPDLITPLSKRWETSASFVGFLNNLIEEGIVEVRTFALSKKFHHPVKCGLIGCITSEQLHDKRHKWIGAGFMSRLIPVSWSYPNSIRSEILDFITERKYRKNSSWAFKFPDQDIAVNLLPQLAKKLLPYTDVFAKAQSTYGFRHQKHLQRLAMASTIADGRDIVSMEDISKVIQLTEFINLDANTIS